MVIHAIKSTIIIRYWTVIEASAINNIPNLSLIRIEFMTVGFLFSQHTMPLTFCKLNQQLESLFKLLSPEFYNNSVTFDHQLDTSMRLFY